MPRKASTPASADLFANVATADETVTIVRAATAVDPAIAERVTMAILSPRGLVTGKYYPSKDDRQYIADVSAMRKVIGSIFPDRTASVRPAVISGHDGVTQVWTLRDKIVRGPRLPKGEKSAKGKAAA